MGLSARAPCPLFAFDETRSVASVTGVAITFQIWMDLAPKFSTKSLTALVSQKKILYFLTLNDLQLNTIYPLTFGLKVFSCTYTTLNSY